MTVGGDTEPPLFNLCCSDSITAECNIGGAMLPVIVVAAAAGAAIRTRSHRTRLIATKRPSPAPLPAAFAQTPRPRGLSRVWRQGSMTAAKRGADRAGADRVGAGRRGRGDGSGDGSGIFASIPEAAIIGNFASIQEGRLGGFRVDSGGPNWGFRVDFRGFCIDFWDPKEDFASIQEAAKGFFIEPVRRDIR